MKFIKKRTKINRINTTTTKITNYYAHIYQNKQVFVNYFHTIIMQFDQKKKSKRDYNKT